MAGFIVYQYKKPTEREVKKTIKQIQQWFDEHPKRKICRAELWRGEKRVRKEHIEEDVREMI